MSLEHDSNATPTVNTGTTTTTTDRLPGDNTRTTEVHTVGTPGYVEQPRVAGRRNDDYNDRPTEQARASRVGRASWGGIIAGAVVAAVLTAMLTLLGVGIGLISTDSFASANDFAIGSAIWYVIAGTVALFIGGWIASRLSNAWTGLDGALHGLTAWGVSTILAAYLATTILGTLLSGVFGMANSALQATGSAAAGLANATGTVAAQGIQEAGDAVGAVIPDDISLPTGQLAGLATNLLSEAGIQPGQALENVQDAPIKTTEQFVQQIQSFVTDAGDVNRQDLVDFVTNNSELNEQQVNQRLDEVRSTYQDAKSQVTETYADAKQEVTQTASELATDARQTAQAGYSAGTDMLGQAALWSFVVLLLGAAAATAGGYLGKPKRDDFADDRR